jgi:quercetin dioxygenase-like cupin family protein
MRVLCRVLTGLALATAMLGLTTTANAQQAPVTPPAITQGTQGIKRTILQRHDVPGTNLETIVALVEVAANFKAGRHSHPGNVTGYVMEGEFFMTLDGQPEKALKAGDSLLVPNAAIHDEGTKDKPARIIAVYVVEKGKPLATPVAAK